MREAEKLFPQSPEKGPPLPRFMEVEWPWRRSSRQVYEYERVLPGWVTVTPVKPWLFRVKEHEHTFKTVIGSLAEEAKDVVRKYKATKDPEYLEELSWLLEGELPRTLWEEMREEREMRRMVTWVADRAMDYVKAEEYDKATDTLQRIPKIPEAVEEFLRIARKELV